MISICVGASSCDLPGNSTGNMLDSLSNASGSASGTAASGSSPTAASQDLSIAQVTAQQVNLGTSVSVPVTIQSQNNYSGPVNLSIDNKVLAANDPMGTIAVSVSPSMLNLTAGMSSTATVTFTTLSNSPDLTNSVNLIASTSVGQVQQSIPIQVMAVYEVDILGPSGAVENWSVPPLSTVNFTQHKNGITLNFVNKYVGQASGTVRIHSSATAYQHQGGEGLGVPGQTTTPSATLGATSTATASVTAGDTYSVTVLSQSSMLADSSYDHNNENPGKASRKFVFNAYSAPPTIGNSGNPNASYAYIKTNVITPMCASCHVTQNMGDVDLSSYASTLGYLQAGSAMGSSLYISIAPGGSMPEGNPGSVSASLVQDVQDWIDDGALNN